MTNPLAAQLLSDSLPAGVRAESRAKGQPALNTDVFDTVWRESGWELARLAVTLGLSPSDAEDVVQDVYLTALRAPGKRPAAARELRLWLFRVTVNRCKLEHRRRARWRRLVDRFWKWGKSGEQESAAADCERRQNGSLVQGGLANLKDELKIPLVLRYFCDLDSREIGELLELPDSTVRSRLRAARKLLAAELIKLGYEHE